MFILSFSILIVLMFCGYRFEIQLNIVKDDKLRKHTAGIRKNVGVFHLEARVCGRRMALVKWSLYRKVLTKSAQGQGSLTVSYVDWSIKTDE